MESDKNYFKSWESLFLANRSFLISFAFRMTGSLAEAEDLAQETFLECAKIDPATIKNHKSWLTKVCSNKAIDHLKSAASKRETYPGTWLPDAVPDSLQIWENLNSAESPDKNILLSESLTTSFLLLIDKLSPEERAVYLLGEVFEYSFKEISALLNKSDDACRKIAERARKAILQNKPVFTSKKSESSEKLIADFFTAVKSGDHATLLNLLSEKSEFWADGGGKVSAARTILKDPNLIANFFKGIGRSNVFQATEFKLERAQVNARPGVIITKMLPSGVWEFETIFSFEIEDGKIARIYAQRNPDKLSVLLKN